MQLKDATSIFGRVGVLLPLILLFLIAADSAYACPGHTSRVAYRTKSIKTRTVSHMPSTVITYRAPVSYQRCGNALYDTRGARYVAVRSNGTKYVAVRSNDARYVAVRGSGARYVAVRHDDDLYRPKLKRYGGVYDVDYGDEPRRYMAVRRPVYVDTDTRYVKVRRVEPRVRYIAVRNIDIDDDEPRYLRRQISNDRGVRYVGVNRHVSYDPGVRYVAVRADAPRTRYVTMRNIDSGCTRAVALPSCLDQIETTSAKRVVISNGVRNIDDDDDGYLALPRRTKYIAVKDVIDDDDEEYITLQPRMKYVAIRDEIDDDDGYIALRSKKTYVTYARADYCERLGHGSSYIPEAVSTRTISYVPASYDDDDDFDDKAILDGGGATFVADDDIEDAYLSTTPVRAVSATEEISYVPADNVEGFAFHRGSDSRYIVTGNAPPHSIPYVALDEDRVFDDVDPAFLEASGLGATADSVGYAPDEVENIDATTVSYVPVDDIDVETVRYVPINNMDVETVHYVPMEDMHVKTVSYVPTRRVEYLDTYVDAGECETLVSRVETQPVYVADASTVLVEEIDTDLVVALNATRQIAGRFGYRDGFEDGQDAALEGDVYHPENSGDYQKATEGYEDEYGDKDVYKDSYRRSYLAGYKAGFASGNSV